MFPIIRPSESDYNIINIYPNSIMDNEEIKLLHISINNEIYYYLKDLGDFLQLKDIPQAVSSFNINTTSLNNIVNFSSPITQDEKEFLLELNKHIGLKDNNFLNNIRNSNWLNTEEALLLSASARTNFSNKIRRFLVQFFINKSNELLSNSINLLVEEKNKLIEEKDKIIENKDTSIKDLNDKVSFLKVTPTHLHGHYYSIRDFCIIRNIFISKKLSSALGWECTNSSKIRKLHFKRKKVYQSNNFKNVNSYEASILNEIFSEQLEIPFEQLIRRNEESNPLSFDINRNRKIIIIK